MKTRDRLAAALREIADKATPINAAKYRAFAERAETGEFDDYASTHTCPVTQLYQELIAAGFRKFAARVANGEFDATWEESQEWAASEEAGEIFATLPDELRLILKDPRMQN